MREKKFKMKNDMKTFCKSKKVEVACRRLTLHFSQRKGLDDSYHRAGILKIIDS